MFSCRTLQDERYVDVEPTWSNITQWSAVGDRYLVEESQRWLVEDLEMPCVTTWTWSLGLVYVIVLLCGIPALLWAIAAHDRRQRKQTDTQRFLLGGYLDHAWYWEMVVMARKALTVMLTVLLASVGTPAQVLAVLVISSCSFALLAQVRPYEDKELQTLETCALCLQLVTLGSASFVMESAGSGAGVAVCVIGLNLLLIFTLVGKIVSAKAAEGKESLRLCCSKAKSAATGMRAKFSSSTAGAKSPSQSGQVCLDWHQNPLRSGEQVDGNQPQQQQGDPDP